MPIIAAQNAIASDFIDQASKNATPSNDAGRVLKLESDGKLSGFFTKNGTIVNAGETINGATLPVPFYQNKTDNEVYACDGNDTGKLKFSGFVISNGTNGNPVNVQFNGVVAGFTGLDEGEKYYLSDTVGTISTAPGTYEVLVGVAISTTELFIQKGARRRSGNQAIADAGADETTTVHAIDLGFRPSVIRVFATTTFSSGASFQFSFSSGVWHNGLYSMTYASGVSGSGVVDQNTTMIAKLYSGGTTVIYEVTITSVTDTGFSFSVLQKDATPASGTLSWEAEGEL